MKKILLGITGSVAAYKSPELLRCLILAGLEVKSVLTKNGESFVTPHTLQALSGNSVHTALFDLDAEASMGHILLARWADTILIAPASANFIAKLANGLCDDLLSTLCLATTAPMIIVPAMNKHMWLHPATQENISKLKQRNVAILGPDNGLQACGDMGLGRMIEPDAIMQHLLQVNHSLPLSQLNILISAGTTHECIDPVRFITNKSSGKMGYAMVNEAIKMGANVTLVTGPTFLTPPTQCKKILKVTTADEMLQAVETEVGANDIFISTAAVNDYKIMNSFSEKIKRHSNQTLTLELAANVDILAKISHEHPIFTVGFAAETENLVDNAKKKLIAKKVNLMIANDVSNPTIGFDSDHNEVYIVSHLDIIKIERNTKSHIAKTLLQHIFQVYTSQTLFLKK